MPREAFHQELATLDGLVRRMGDLDKQALSFALLALATRDEGAVREALAREPLINELQRAVRMRATNAIALQSPVARDLRELTAMPIVATELERIGDHAKHMANHALHVLHDDTLPVREAVVALGKQAQSQLHAALECLSTRDIVQAHAISQADETLNQAYRAVYSQLLAEMERAPRLVTPLTELLLTARAEERIGDRVINICEDIIFAVTGNIEALQ